MFGGLSGGGDEVRDQLEYGMNGDLAQGSD